MFTHEHLIEDIQNVLQMARPSPGPEEQDRLRRAFEGLHRHLQSDPGVPERVCSCVEESVRVLGAGRPLDEDRWDYARTCLEAALDFAREAAPTRMEPPPSASA